MKGYAYLPGVATLELDRDSCAGCGACTEVCPHRVLAMRDDRAEIVDRDRCMECGACMVNCPTGAIRVQSGVGCAAGLISEWLNSLRPGTVKSCC